MSLPRHPRPVQAAFWRAAYGVLEHEASVRLFASLLDQLSRRRGVGSARAVEGRFVRAFSLLGWPPPHGRWRNLHVSRFLARVRRRRRGSRFAPSRAPDPAADRPLRLGVFGPLSGLLGFPPSCFSQLPPEVELFVYDLEFRGSDAPYLAAVAAGYRGLRIFGTPDEGEAVREAAATVDADRLDVFVNLYQHPVAEDLVGLIDAPCIVHVCSGSDLLHHPKVSFTMYPQPQADCVVRGDRLLCGLTGRPFPRERVVPAFIPYDTRALPVGAAPSWKERDPLIVFHGSLYKAADPDFLRHALSLLVEDPDLRFVLIGKDDGASLARIRDHAEAAGVASRVEYEGAFDAMRDASGEAADPGWGRLRQILGRARLALDPWPMGGGSSRAECYAAGVPVVHLGVDPSPAAWGRPQRAIVDVPALNTVRGTASTPDEYLALARRCLRDPAFAEELVAEQTEIVRRVSDGAAFWRQIVYAYSDWLAMRRKMERGG
ncbi:MAG: hypothetical protein ACT4PT_11485 [Methanobacteriota archaeon]